MQQSWDNNLIIKPSNIHLSLGTMLSLWLESIQKYLITGQTWLSGAMYPITKYLIITAWYLFCLHFKRNS